MVFLFHARLVHGNRHPAFLRRTCGQAADKRAVQREQYQGSADQNQEHDTGQQPTGGAWPYPIRGDEKNPDKKKVLQPGLPALLSFGELKIEQITLPVESYAPGLRPYILKNQFLP